VSAEGSIDNLVRTIDYMASEYAHLESRLATCRETFAESHEAWEKVSAELAQLHTDHDRLVDLHTLAEARIKDLETLAGELLDMIDQTWTEQAVERSACSCHEAQKSRAQRDQLYAWRKRLGDDQ
jgi:chromosome segregation ATPase